MEGSRKLTAIAIKEKALDPAFVQYAQDTDVLEKLREELKESIQREYQDRTVAYQRALDDLIPQCEKRGVDPESPPYHWRCSLYLFLHSTFWAQAASQRLHGTCAVKPSCSNPGSVVKAQIASPQQAALASRSGTLALVLAARDRGAHRRVLHLCFLCTAWHSNT